MHKSPGISQIPAEVLKVWGEPKEIKDDYENI
jgi:hypothetical protein